MRLYIIRHAQSTNNALPDRSNRVSDPSLTELGERQASRLAEFLSESGENRYGITKLYCSAMYRALKTTFPISQSLGLAPEVWADIHEIGGIYLGDDEESYTSLPGKTRSEILAEFPDYCLPSNITENGWWNGPYETTTLLRARAERVAERLCSWAANEETITMVSHAGFINVLLHVLLQIDQEANIFFHHRNTAVTSLRFFANGMLDIRFMNDTRHLPPELLSTSVAIA
jgi:broad specificity phosphatase PhoE